MSNIALLYTGGTIGATVKEGRADVGDGQVRALVSHYRATHPACHTDFMESEPLRILSENLTVDCWNKLLSALQALDFTRLDGVIVTHGTDTLGFTAGLLAVALAGIAVPVVLVSSHAPLDDATANGHRHFAAAVEGIENRMAPGVYVALSVQGASGQVRLVPASGVTQCAPLSHQFGMVPERAFPPLAEKASRLTPCVLLVQPYPGLDYRAIALPPGTRAVLHGLYHSGTACMEGTSTGLGTLATRCRQVGIPLFVCPTPAEDAAYLYGTTRDMLETDVHPLRSMTLESAYGLLLIGCALSGDAAGLLRFLKNYQ